MAHGTSDPLGEGIGPLTEAEIQDRLYGHYFGRRKKKVQTRFVPSQKPGGRQPSLRREPDPGWPKEEVLKNELNQLRTELIVLRKEKEVLLSDLKNRRVVVEPSWEVPPPQKTASASLGKLTCIAVVLSLVGYAVGVGFIQAYPAGNELSPYTIQVAVYDVKPLAEQAVTYLKGLGYPAFLKESPRASGKARYRIYVGHYVTREEAEQEQERLVETATFSDAFVRFQ